jgi:hypothetical protein
MPYVTAFKELEENPMSSLWIRVESYKDDLRQWIAAEEKYQKSGAIKINADGKVSVGFGRTDLGRLYYKEVGTIWLERNLSYEVFISGVVFSEEEVAQVKRSMDEFIEANLTHLLNEKRFYEWLFGPGFDALSGATPEEALAAIEAAGF